MTDLTLESKLVFTMRETRILLGLSKNALYEEIDAKRLKTHWRGKRTRVAKQENLKSWLDSLPEGKPTGSDKKGDEPGPD